MVGIQGNHLELVKRKYRVDTSRISFLKFILEAYDGMAQITTLDPVSGVVEVSVVAKCVNDFENIIMDLKNQMLIEIVEFSQENVDHR